MKEPTGPVIGEAFNAPGGLCWIWPFRHDRRTATKLWHWAGAGNGVTSPRRCWLFALAAGLLPIAAAYLCYLPQQQALTSLLLFVPFIALVRDDRFARAIALVGLVIGMHSLMAIVLAALDPSTTSQFMPGAEDYWQKQEVWLRTGKDPEYETKNWLPAHLQLLGGVTALSFTSLGFIPLLEGMKEVDLMNFYVGRLASASASPVTAVMIGWHLWSILRGLAYAVLVFEVASLSLERLSGRILSTRRRRAWRWSLGLGLFACDCAVKCYTLEGVRNQLIKHLQA